MKYDLYIIENETRKLFKRNVDGEVVRKYISSLNEEQREHIEIEHIREEVNSPEDIMRRRNEYQWEK